MTLRLYRWLGGTILAALALTSASCAGTVAGTPQAPSVPATGPSVLTGPGADASVMAEVLVAPGFFCSVPGPQVGTLTLSSDGAVLESDGIGAHCQPVPTVTASWVDPATTRRLLDNYFASAASRADLDIPSVTDLATTQLAYTDAAGGVHKVAAYGLGFDDLSFASVPAPVLDAQRELSRVLDALDAAAQPSAPWTPDRLTVVPDRDPYSAVEANVPDWPLATTAAAVAVVTGTSECEVLTGADVAVVLAAAAARATAGSTWTIDGAPHEVAIGVVLPGSEPCA